MKSNSVKLELEKVVYNHHSCRLVESLPPLSANDRFWVTTQCTMHTHIYMLTKAFEVTPTCLELDTSRETILLKGSSKAIGYLG